MKESRILHPEWGDYITSPLPKSQGWLWEKRHTHKRIQAAQTELDRLFFLKHVRVGWVGKRQILQELGEVDEYEQNSLCMKFSRN